MRHLILASCLSLALSAMPQDIIPDSLSLAPQVVNETLPLEFLLDDPLTSTDSIPVDSIPVDTLAFPPVVIRDLDEILLSLPDTMPQLPYNPVVGPWVFSGYRSINPRTFADAIPETVVSFEQLKNQLAAPSSTPRWLREVLTQSRISQDYMYETMVYNPVTIQYTYWGLPVPPRLPEDDVTLGSYIRNLDLPEVTVADAYIPEFVQKRMHWLHKFNTGLQFSQAYVSKNWYKGGNNYVALLFNFYWDVQLNPTYHPNEIFQSTFSYKLGVNSIEQNSVGRKYSISEDALQYNVKYGFKAFRKWFYTVTGQFKTQFMNNYKSNSTVKSASFLSPADLNLGLGMTYSMANKKKTFNLSASIAPISYNMKICIDKNIDHAQFNIKPGHKTHNEFGSSGEANFTWQVTPSISTRTRVFTFTDYSYFQGNVETTWDFAINKFLSTQLYANLRYDSSSDFNLSKWHHWMLKEILSFGLSYSFSTK